ncbi:signal transduction protein [Hahella sp. CCB-MM4]|uniref:HDOD domain-containing protein n=1 Tax=Hahella sp. (strain CCB-MM4) TaxID=1926491 RepID=UPI000B9AD1C6|nr:HDOD domain-containing protein [Hahella sp. CCB-MM4]OZG71961.1 signal transduction protein [Hahella sp. CCB-MM4]
MEDLKHNLEALKHFTLLEKLSDEQLIVLASRADSREYRRGQVILERGSRDSSDYYLLEGEVKLEAQDGRSVQVAAGSERARQPIAHLQPRQFTVTAVKQSTMLIVDQPTLTQMLKNAPQEFSMSEAGTAMEHADNPAYALVSSFYQDLNAHRLSLPSLPDMAMRIRTMTEQNDCNIVDVAKAIMRDPSITAKLIHAANSPLYRGFKEIESCEDAVVRLGLDATRQLITIFTLRELFKSKYELLQKKMSALWKHTMEVGSIAFVLARMTPGLKPEQAMLAGILHDIGVVPVIKYAEEHPVLRTHQDMLEAIIPEVREEIGCALLENWGFPDVFVEAARQAENYRYDSGNDKPSYADIVIVAQVHAFIGKPEHAAIPQMDQIPAFHKLALGELSPQRSLQVMQMAREEIEGMQSILR